MLQFLYSSEENLLFLEFGCFCRRAKQLSKETCSWCKTVKCSQDPDSSAAAWYYANIMNYFITFTIIFTIWQAAADPPVSRLIEGIMQISVEASR